MPNLRLTHLPMISTVTAWYQMASIKTKVVSLVTIGLVILLTGWMVFFPHRSLHLQQVTLRMGQPLIAQANLAYPNQAKVAILSNGKEVGIQGSITALSTGSLIRVAPPQSLPAGKYTLKVTDGDGVTLMQDFSWGVLAINTDQSIYAPNDTVNFSLAVLNDKGEMVCDATVNLTITDPQHQVVRLSTTSHEITRNPECHQKVVTLKPDYSASFQAGVAGEYAMELTAITANGKHSITDTFTVKDELAFKVQRSEATRIYPIQAYPVSLTITAHQDFDGEISETVPYSFDTSPTDKEGESYAREEFNATGPEYYRTRTLVWKVTMHKGQQTTISYQYDAPDVSPDFFLTGPLTLTQHGHVVFKEARQWQIANDAISTAVEQQINIIDQNYSTTSQSPAPTDNSLGQVNYDADKYNNQQVYLEATLGNTSANGLTGAYIGNNLAMSCLSATDCKMLYVANSSLMFKDCDDATCSTGTTTLLDGSFGCSLTKGTACGTVASGAFTLTPTSLQCSSSSSCQMAYYTSTNSLIFASCDTATCSSGTRRILDGGAGCALTSGSGCSSTNKIVTLSLSCPTTDSCRIAYASGTSTSTTNLTFGSCNDSTCSNGTRTILDGIANCTLRLGVGCLSSNPSIRSLSIQCITANNCKIAYYDYSTQALYFADCTDDACSSGTKTAIDGVPACTIAQGVACSTSNNEGQGVSLQCLSVDDCKMVYQDATNFDLMFVDCDDAQCTNGTRRILDGNTGCTLTAGNACDSAGTAGSNATLQCPTTSECQVAFSAGTYSSLYFGHCNDATCSSGTRSLLNGGPGCSLMGLDHCIAYTPAFALNRFSALICVSLSQCKIGYINSATNTSFLQFASCDSATCSSGSNKIIDGTGAGWRRPAINPGATFCPTANNCKIVYGSANGNNYSNLRLKSCNTNDCSSGTITLLDGGYGCSLTQGSPCSANSINAPAVITCPSSNDCKIVYRSSSGLIFADCDDEICSSGTRTVIDAGPGCALTAGNPCVSSGFVGQTGISIQCPTAADCRVAYTYYLSSTYYLAYAQCNNALCSSGTRRILDGAAGCTLTAGSPCITNGGAFYGSTPTLQCPSTTSCKVLYETASNGASLIFGSCDDATCGSGTRRVLDGAAGCTLTAGSPCVTNPIIRSTATMQCLTADDCKLAYYDGSGLLFGDCDDTTCSTGTRRILDGESGCVLTSGATCRTAAFSGNYNSLQCPTATSCKVLFSTQYYDFSISNNINYLTFASCNDATCSNGTRQLLAGYTGCTLTGGEGCAPYYYADVSLQCPTATDCRAFYLSTSTNLIIGNCADAICSSGKTTTMDNGGELTILSLFQGSTRVPGATLSYQPPLTKPTSMTLVRSMVPFNLSTGIYSIRIGNSDYYSSSTIASVTSARLIVDQTDAGEITKTESQVELGNNESTTSTSYAMLLAPKIYLYDAHAFDGTVVPYFEASLKGSAAGVTASAFLSTSNSCATSVAGSSVSVTGVNWSLARSSALSLTDDTEYWICFKTSSGTASIANAKLIIDQSNPSGLSAIQVVHQLANTSSTTSAATYSDQGFLATLATSKFAGQHISVNYEATMKTSANVGYTRLQNLTDNSNVPGSEISTISPTFTRVRSSDLLPNLSLDKLVSQMAKSSAANTTAISNSWLIISIGSAPTPSTAISGGTSFTGGAIIH